jgi:hypothetical protein
MKKVLIVLFAVLLIAGNGWAWGDWGGSSGGGGVHELSSDPDANYDINDGVSIGDIAVNTTSDESFVCADNTAGSAVWDSITEAAAGAATEDIQDAAGAMVTTTNTETLITVTYQDATNDIDFVVDPDLAKFTWTNVDDADIPDTISVGASGSIDAGALPLVNEDIGALVDPGADRLGFWDDSASAFVWLTPGTGLTITGTTITAGVPDEDAIEAYIFDADAETIAANWDNTANPWAVNEGGTGAATLTDGGILLGSGTGAVTALGVATNGQIPIGDGTTDPVLATVTGTANELTVTNGAGSITLSLPASVARGEGELIDLSAITMSAGVDEGIALPTFDDVAPDTEKYYAAYDPENNVIMVRESGGWVDTSAASGASASGNYIAHTADGALTDERVLTAGTYIDTTDAGTDGGAFTVAVDTTEMDAVTFSDGANASNVWTFDVSGTDHTMTAGDGVMTFGDAVTVTDTLTASGNVTDGTATWNSSTQAMTGFSNITSTQFTIGSAGITEAELEILDGATLGTADINIIDGISDSGDLTAAELLYVDGVTSAIQGQLDARALESVVGTSLEADDLTNNSGVLELVAEIPHTDAAQSWTADQTVNDGAAIIIGSNSDWNIEYDETTDDRLEFTNIAGTNGDSGVLWDLNDGSASTFAITNSGAGVANLAVDGTVSQGGNQVIDAATSWSGGDLGGTGIAPTVTDLSIASEAQGTILYHNGSGWEVLPVSDNGKVLTTHSTGNNPTWETVTATPAGDDDPAGQIQYRDSGALAAEDAFYYTAGTNTLVAANVTSSGTVTANAVVTNSIDGSGAVDIDYGSNDITDHSFTTDDCTVIIDGGITISTGDTLTIGSTQWDDGSDKFDGEQTADGTIDDDALDFSSITLADFDYEPTWNMFYSNGSGDVTALALGAAGVPIVGGGAAAAPTFGDMDPDYLINDTVDDGLIDQELVAGFSTSGSATPGLTAYDSGAPGADKEIGKIYWNDDGTGGDGTEDGDWFIQAMVGGSETDIVRYDNSDAQVEVTVDLNAASNIEMDDGVVFIKEQADADADREGYGQLWVNTATPNELYFTDDAGTDHQLGTAGSDENTIEGYIFDADAESITGVWTVGTDVHLQFRDSAIYINSGADGYLDLEADTGIRFNAPVTFVNEGSIALPVESVNSDQYVDGSVDVEHVENDLKTHTLEWVYSDASETTATKESNAIRIPTGASWTTAYMRCDDTEEDLVYTLYYHATGGTLASLGTIAHDSGAATDSYDISGFTDPVAGGWVGVDITTAATTATGCTLALELIGN